MKENKKTPIIYGNRIQWARFEYKAGGHTYSRRVELWLWHDDTMRVYFGHRRIRVYTFAEVCDILPKLGWKLVQGGC